MKDVQFPAKQATPGRTGNLQSSEEAWLVDQVIVTLLQAQNEIIRPGDWLQTEGQ